MTAPASIEPIPETPAVAVAFRAAQSSPNRPTFLSNLSTVFAGQALCALVALTIEVCNSRLLGPAGRGQVSLCMMAIAVCATFAGLGGELPIVVWTANNKRKTSEWLPAIWFWAVIGCLTFSSVWTVLYWRWHPSFLRGISSPLAALVLMAIPISVLFTYTMAFLAGMERFRDRAGLSLASQVAELGGILCLVSIFGRTAQNAILGNLLGLSLAVLLGFAVLRRTFRASWRIPDHTQHVKDALSLGVRGQLGNLAAFMNYRLDVFVVNYFLDPAQVGLYALGVVISESLWQIPQAVATALFPRTARTIDDGAGSFTCLVTRHVFFLACIFGLILALISPIAIPLVFGARFAPSVGVVWWILPGTVALAVAKVMSADISARGKPEFNSLSAFIALIVTILLDFTLIPRMGIAGAALASSLTYILEATIIAFALKHFLKAPWRLLFVPTFSELKSYRRLWTILLPEKKLEPVRAPENSV
jgi:O-antigen/teichoic acid export membrane protein